MSDLHISEFCRLVAGLPHDSKRDGVVAHLSHWTGLTMMQVCQYVSRCGLDLNWGRHSDPSPGALLSDVVLDITHIAQRMADFHLMGGTKELIKWFVGEFPKVAAEMEIAPVLAEIDVAIAKGPPGWPAKEQVEVFLQEADVQVLLDRGVGVLDLSSRTRKRLLWEKIKTLRDLVQRTDANLLTLRGFGLLCLNEVTAELAKLNLTLGMDVSKRELASVARNCEFEDSPGMYEVV